MTVEDELRTTMRAHDDEAPTRVPWPITAGPDRPRHPRRAARQLLVAALVGVLAAGATWLAVDWPHAARTTSGTTTAPLTCPPAWQGGLGSTTSSTPSVADAGSRLAPTTTPDSVLVCGYAGSIADHGESAGPVPLTGAATLTGDLAPVADSLTFMPRGQGPRSCALYLTSTDLDNYLIGLTYPDGTLWIGAPGSHCDGSYNSEFSSSANLRAAAAAWLAAGHFVAAEDIDGGVTTPCAAPPGRLGQDTAMVPDTPSTLTICSADSSGGLSVPTVVPAGRVAEVVSALNALPTESALTTHPCESTGADPAGSSALRFDYRSGPGVQVLVVTGCRSGTSLDNGSLRGDASSALLALLADLVP